ncbi:MAG TPA: response regulator [Ignavibacteriaceae bacterium]|nr:response regulator [Ignavibacteriaceae bacterium]
MKNGKNKFRKLNLLLVEDDDINAKIIVRFLEEDYNIDWVKSGYEAIDLSAKKKFDGFLMDISLKGELDGLMTTGRIRKLPGYESTPIIAVTAFAMVGDKERFLNGGCSHYISKPFTKPELLFLLKKIFI